MVSNFRIYGGGGGILVYELVKDYIWLMGWNR